MRKKLDVWESLERFNRKKDAMNEKKNVKTKLKML